MQVGPERAQYRRTSRKGAHDPRLVRGWSKEGRPQAAGRKGACRRRSECCHTSRKRRQVNVLNHVLTRAKGNVVRPPPPRPAPAQASRFSMGARHLGPHPSPEFAFLAACPELHFS